MKKIVLTLKKTVHITNLIISKFKKMKGYTQIENIENYLLTEIRENFQYQINEWIENAENYIDKKTGRNFIADTIPLERSYDGDGTSELLIDDCVSIEKIEIKTTSGDIIYNNLQPGIDYFLEPANEIPKQSIRLKGIFPKGIQNIKITAKWGYSEEVPKDIKFATTVLVANIVSYSNQSNGEIQSLNVGSYSVSFKDQEKRDDFEKVEEILDSYVKY